MFLAARIHCIRQQSQIYALAIYSRLIFNQHVCVPALIISFYCPTVYVFSCPDSLHSSAVARQSGNPGPLLANQRPPSQLRRVRVFWFQGWPVLWYPATAPVAVDLQVALSTTFFSLLTHYVKLHAPSTYQHNYSYNVFDIIHLIILNRENKYYLEIAWRFTSFGYYYNCMLCITLVSLLIFS